MLEKKVKLRRIIYHIVVFNDIFSMKRKAASEKEAA